MPWLKRVVPGFPPRRPGFASGKHVGFVMDKATLEQVFPEYLGFPSNHHSSNFSIILITRSWHNRHIGGGSAEWTQLDSTLYTNLKFLISYIEVLHNFITYSTPYIIRVIKWRGFKQFGLVARTGKEIRIQNFILQIFSGDTTWETYA
jgi:hypothetical protein